MGADLKEAQEQENARAATFAELRSAKESEIANNEKMAEEKEEPAPGPEGALAVGSARAQVQRAQV